MKNNKVNKKNDNKLYTSNFKNKNKSNKEIEKKNNSFDDQVEGRNSVLELLSKVISELSHSEMHLEKIKDKRVQVEEAYYLLEESTRDIRDIANEVYYDENEYSVHTNKQCLYHVDYYDKTLNIIIEFYGDFFHLNPKIYDANFI